jgi:hypothetical protein
VLKKRGRSLTDFLDQNCELKLRQGLEELYLHHPAIATVSKEQGKLFTDHDLTHIVFGCDTTLVGEIMSKPWIFLAALSAWPN